eukprot:scaffold442_cov268-Pinguiococcus_pyrenoidosus.AAC.18
MTYQYGCETPSALFGEVSRSPAQPACLLSTTLHPKASTNASKSGLVEGASERASFGFSVTICFDTLDRHSCAVRWPGPTYTTATDTVCRGLTASSSWSICAMAGQRPRDLTAAEVPFSNEEARSAIDALGSSSRAWGRSAVPFLPAFEPTVRNGRPWSGRRPMQDMKIRGPARAVAAEQFSISRKSFPTSENPASDSDRSSSGRSS